MNRVFIPSLILLVFLTGFLFNSCQSKSREVPHWNFENKNLEKESCVGGHCAKVNLSYPYFLGERDSVSFLNDKIEEQMVMFLNYGENQEIVPLDSAVSYFLRDYLNFKKDFDTSQEWEIAVQAHITFQDSDLITVVFDSYSYTGGAHPNSYRLYLNFEKAGKTPMTNQKLIKDSLRLKALAETKFREYHEVGTDVSLKDDGRFFLENESDFFLPVAMGFEGEEFVLYYNPYEIGPYVLGATELRFSRDELTGLVKFIH